MTTPTAPADAAATSGASRWTVALCALLGLGIGLAVFATRTPIYEAETLIDVTNPTNGMEAEVAAITSDATLDIAEALVGSRPTVTVTASEITGILTVTSTSDDPADAAETANAVASTYIQAQRGSAATIVQQAEVPSSATSLGALVYATVGSLVGALIGLLVAAVLRARNAPLPELTSLAHDQPIILTMPDRDPATESPASALASPVAARGTAHEPESPLALPTSPRVTAGNGPAPTRSHTSITPSVSTAATPTGVAAAATPTPAASVIAHVTAPDASLETPTPMKSKPSSFTDAAQADAAAPSWRGPKSTVSPAALDGVDLHALQTKHDSERYELVLAHDEELARKRAEHERSTNELRAEIANLNKQLRMQTVRLKSRSGDDQSRAGDLEAQVDALEVELAESRRVLEAERIAHTRRITDERGAADRALDNARREYREELAKHVHVHRQTIAEYREDLDTELAQDRARHAAALDEQHVEYEKQIEAERARADAKIVAGNDRNNRDIESLRSAHQQELDRQAAQHKTTISDLRASSDTSDAQLRDLEKQNRALSVEVSTLQKQARQLQTDHQAAEQRLRDELSVMKSELEGERERNAALRADVLRRSAEAHQAIDRAVEERTAQLAELEASVGRQRQYADTRVREISAAAEEQAREAASREATLTATISRLTRELAEAKPAGRQNPPAS